MVQVSLTQGHMKTRVQQGWSAVKTNCGQVLTVTSGRSQEKSDVTLRRFKVFTFVWGDIRHRWPPTARPSAASVCPHTAEDAVNLLPGAAVCVALLKNVLHCFTSSQLLINPNSAGSSKCQEMSAEQKQQAWLWARWFLMITGWFSESTK